MKSLPPFLIILYKKLNMKNCGIKRETANKLLDELIERVRQQLIKICTILYKII